MRNMRPRTPNPLPQVGVVMALLLLAPPARAADPVLSRVTLSSGGVAQYEFTADIDGAATLPLDVPLDQVDDLLKSLRVDDPAGPPSLRLPGREPLSESFRTLPFAPTAFASADALLGALIGEGVRLPGSGVTGRVLAVTAFEAATPQATMTRHRLTIMTGVGVETAVLEDTPSVELTSDALRTQIGAALGAIAQARVQDRRTVQLTLAPGGPRTLRFGYVTPAPVWKASYRLTIPAEGDGARLQAFAVVESLSGRTWRDVQVVLTSGQPVLYHQPLYEAVFTTRPEAPVEVPNRLTPQVDQGSAPLPAMAPPPSSPSPSPALMGAGFARMEARAAAPAAALAEARQSVAQVSFTLATRISAASGETLLLPIIDRTVPARRVALIQPGQPNPLVALLLRNDGTGAWPPGLATLYQRNTDQPGFIGDARLPAIQPQEDRLASFAADLAVRVDTSQEADALITTGRAARGVLELVRQERAVTSYRITTPPGSGRTMLVDHPKREGWTLAEPGTDVAETPTAYRITRTVPPGTTETLRVVLTRPRGERIVLTDLPTPRLLALSEEGVLSPALRASLARAVQLRAELDRRTQALAGLQQRREAIVADQDRIRQNLNAVPAQSELQRRYLGQMQQQETELAALATQDASARRAVADAEAALRDAVVGAS